MVTIGTTKEMQDGRETTSIAIEAFELIVSTAETMLDKLHVAIVVTAMNAQTAQGRQCTVAIEMIKGLVISKINPHVLGLVDQA